MGAAENQGVTFSGPSVELHPAVVQTLALAIHELATNARKHGALSIGGGRLSIAWQLRDDAGERRLFIEWREDGLPRGQDANTKATGGYGRQLIERSLPHTLGAETSFDLASDRLRCTIDLPLDWPADPVGIAA